MASAAASSEEDILQAATEEFLQHCRMGMADHVRPEAGHTEEVLVEGLVASCAEGHANVASRLVLHFQQYAFPAVLDLDYLFILACKNGKDQIVEMLLDFEGDNTIPLMTRKGLGLAQACQEGRTEVVRLLLELGGERTMAVHSDNEDLFRYACDGGHEDVVRLLLNVEGRRAVDVHANQEQGFRFACGGGHEEVVRYLLALSGEKTIDVHVNREVAFRSACRGGHEGVLRLLLGLEGDRAIDVHASADGGFRNACFNGQEGAIRMLLHLEGDRAISVLAHDDKCLKVACTRGHAGAVRALLGHTRPPVPQGIIESCFNRRINPEIARLLMTAGPNRLPSRKAYDICGGVDGRSYAFWLYENRPRAVALVRWRRAGEAWADAAVLHRCCKEGRPLELQKRLVVGRHAVSREGLEALMATAEVAGHVVCVKAVREVL